MKEKLHTCRSNSLSLSLAPKPSRSVLLVTRLEGQRSRAWLTLLYVYHGPSYPRVEAESESESQGSQSSSVECGYDAKTRGRTQSKHAEKEARKIHALDFVKLSECRARRATMREGWENELGVFSISGIAMDKDWVRREGKENLW
jgi:hypothetical protein